MYSDHMFRMALIALVVTAFFHLLAQKFFARLGLLDFPERYGIRRARLPYPTGIFAVLVFLGFFLVLEPLTQKSLGLLLGIVLLAVFSFLDDRTPLPSSLRLLIQVCVAVIIFLSGTRIFSLTNPLEPWIGLSVIKLDTWVLPSPAFSNPSLIGLVFTIVWLGLTMNALNWFDGIPGQVSLLSLIGFLTIGLLSLSSRVDQPELARLALVLAGIAGACFLFDIPPPRVLMGDTGAMFFGLLLGVLTIYTGGKVATAFLVLGVPLIDSIFVGLRRISRGASPFRGSVQGEHLHHRLLAKGWSARQVILLTAVLGSSFGITALFLSTLGKFIAAGVLLLVMLGLSWYTRTKDEDLDLD